MQVSHFAKKPKTNRFASLKPTNFIFIMEKPNPLMKDKPIIPPTQTGDLRGIRTIFLRIPGRL